MLKRYNRLRGQELFRQAFAQGKRASVGPVTFFSLPQKNGTLVVGVTFKQAAFPKAVTRHWYRRKVYLWVRQYIDQFPSGLALVIYFRSQIEGPLPMGLYQILNQLKRSL